MSCFPVLSYQIAASLEKNLIPRLGCSPPDIEALRLYLTLPECPLFKEPNTYVTLAIPFAKSLISLKDPPLKVLGRLMYMLGFSFFTHCFRTLANNNLKHFFFSFRKLVVSLRAHCLSEAGGAVQGGGGVSAEDAQSGHPPIGAEDLHLLLEHITQALGDPARGGQKKNLLNWCIVFFTTLCFRN